ncbi:MAG: TetR family transcriptional regulator [Bryobacterales bacterium]|nr:TetR family transcriptional regulator [Bryobacterales bacterium]
MSQTFEPVTSRPDTKERILDAAEKLFADHGVTATSLRQITAAAGVNLAAVNYHFQSKDALAAAVLRRKLEPINEERLRRLDELEASAAGPLELEAVLDCFVQPVFEARYRKGLGHFPRFMARLSIEPGEWVASVLQPSLGPLLVRFFGAFQRALPQADPQEIFWGIFFGVGSFVHTLAHPTLFTLMARTHGIRPDDERVAHRLVCFFAAGLRGLTEDARTPGGNGQ